MKLAVAEKEKKDEVEVFNLQQAIKKQQREFEELLELDKKENRIIQELNQAKKELAQAEKELIICQEGEKLNLDKASELMNLTIPSRKEKVKKIEKEAN